MHGHDPVRIRRARTLSRFVGAAAGMALGILYGTFVVGNSSGFLTQNKGVALAALLSAGLVGAVCLALAAPVLSIDPYLWLERTVEEAPASQILGATLGLIVSLLIAALVAVLLSPLPWDLGVIISVAIAVALTYLAVRAGSRRRDAFFDVFARGRGDAGGQDVAVGEPAPQDGQAVVLDTSVLIDGRIVDVAGAGFVPGRLLLPGFVLEELQRIADSADPVRRAKGRRGLGVVETLRQERDVRCELIDLDFPGTPEVDSRLVKTARVRGAAIMTQDFNLNRLARIEGVRVLNLNDLANAVKPIVASGESMTVTIVKEGKEAQQGVGYLEDGTMVVVERGRSHQNETVNVTVTSVLQTAAGRMIFAALSGGEEQPAEPARSSRAARVAHR